MALHRVCIMRGRDYEDGSTIAALRFALPDGREGLAVIDRADVFGVELDLMDATDQQIIDRLSEYAGSRLFLIDLLNDRMLVANSPSMEKWQATLETIYVGELYLYGVDNTLEK